MRTFFSVAAIAATLVGCNATNPPIPATDVPIAHQDADKPMRTARNLTVTWDNIGRGGAAMRQPGFIDVLSQENSFGPEQNYMRVPQSKHVAPVVTPTAAKPPKTSNKTSYSTYELQRWQRYCDQGRGMDSKDWRFVRAQNFEVPEGAFPNCKPAPHTSVR